MKYQCRGNAVAPRLGAMQMFPITSLRNLAALRLAAAAALLILLALPAAAEDPLSRYAYKNTRDLVSLVEDAAGLVETKGEDAFKDFSVKGSRWLEGNTYVFVYADDGTVAFHPISPELVGKRMASLRDIDGKTVVQQLMEIGQLPAADASGWVFYRWQDQRQLTPVWKASFIRKAVAPDGKAYLVGSGLYEPKIEKAFVEDRVNLACDVLLKEGKDKAFAAFTDGSSHFVFLDTYIFVLDANGDALVDPAFPTLTGRHMKDFSDAVGAKPVQQLLDKLAHADSAWVQFLWPHPGEVVPSRKLIYARKVVVNGETLIVGANIFLATPIWMKVEDSRTWPAKQQG